MGSPLNALLDRLKPNVICQRSRGSLTTEVHTFVRPVRFDSSEEFSPRASQVVSRLENAMAATETVMATLANSRRTRIRTANMLRPATSRPAASEITSVLVCDSSSMIASTADMGPARRPDISPQNHSTTTSPSATAA